MNYWDDEDDSMRTWDQSLVAYYRKRDAKMEAAAKRDIERLRQEEQAKREVEAEQMRMGYEAQHKRWDLERTIFTLTWGLAEARLWPDNEINDRYQSDWRARLTSTRV